MSSSSIGSLLNPVQTVVESTMLQRFLPEPRTRSGVNFSQVLRGVGSLISGGVSSFSGIDPVYQDLLAKQIEMQQQMQLVTMASNIEKSRHETQMAPVRNIRVG